MTFLVEGLFHAGMNKIRAKFGDIWCRKSLMQDGQETEKGVQLAGFWKFIAGKKERLETGCACAGHVQGGTIANVKNLARVQAKL